MSSHRPSPFDSDEPDEVAPLVRPAPVFDPAEAFSSSRQWSSGHVESEAPDSALWVLPAQPRLRAWEWLTVSLTWIGIVAVIALNLLQLRPASAASEADPPGIGLIELQAKYIVWAAQMPGANKQRLLTQASAIGQQGAREYQAFVVLAGELAGPERAVFQLLQTPWERDDIDDILMRLYRDYEKGRWSAPSLTPEEMARLRSEMRWCGELALAPAAGPDSQGRTAVLAAGQRTTVAMVTVGIGALGFAGLGALALAVLGVVWLLGHVQGGIGSGSGSSAIWIETFGLYVLVFLGLSLTSWLVRGPLLQMALAGAAALLSLVTLFWPRARGLSWVEIRRDIGWTAGQGIIREIGAGVATYIMALPILGVGIIAMFIIMSVVRSMPARAEAADVTETRTAPAPRPPVDNAGAGAAAPDVAPPAAPHGPAMPAHPIVGILPRGGWPLRLVILLLACVIAPIVEETMFRGVLYRHLRQATGRWGGVLSFIVSTTIVSFVFAAVHPQGWMAIPVLMGIAAGLTIAREWRTTLIPSMIAHGLNNGLAMLVLMIALG